MNRILLLLALLPAAATAQQTAPPQEGSNWQHVQALPPGTSIYVSAHARHQACRLRRVDADSLTCASGNNPVYSRAEITSIKLAHRGRSALVGAGIGGGAGALIGFTAGTSSGGFFGANFLRGAVTGVCAAIGGAAGAGVGAATDLTRSTVYKAP